MIKALLKLCVLGMAPILFLSISDVLNPMRAVSQNFIESFVSESYLGVIQKIEREINQLPEQDRLTAFARIEKQFGYDMQLRPMSELSLPEKKWQRLLMGEIVHIDRDGEVVAYQFRNSNLILSINLEKSQVNAIHKIASGPVFMIRQDLLNLSNIEVSESLNQLTKDYRLPFSIIDLQESEAQLKKNNGHHIGDGIYWYQSDEGADVLHIDIPSLGAEQRLMLGPLNYQRYEWMGLTIFLLCTVVLTLLCLLLWVYPLWKDHKNLDKAAADFGSGKLDSRVKVRKGSLAVSLSQSFNAMADNVQNLIRTNQNLTNAVAHDLRTPLARLRFANEIMVLNDCTQEESERYRKTINKSIDSLDYLINQTLMHSRYNRAIDIKHFSRSNFTFKIHEEVEQFEFDYENLKFVTHIDHELSNSEQFIDEKALGRALSNLLSNAVKYADSIIRVSYFSVQDFIHLQVEDDGHGIAPENADLILQPFSQLDNEERDLAQGHGLGLAIVNQIARWHKGEVLIEKSDLGGASVAITLNKKTE